MPENTNTHTSGDESQEHKISDAVLNEFMHLSSDDENEKIQKYITWTLIPNVRNKLNGILRANNIDLRVPNGKYFNHVGTYQNILPMDTKTIEGLQQAVGIMFENLPKLNLPNASKIRKDMIQKLAIELQQLKVEKNATAEQVQRTVENLRNQTNQTVQNVMPQPEPVQPASQNAGTRQQPAAQRPRPQEHAGAHPAHQEQHAAEHAHAAHGSHEQDHDHGHKKGSKWKSVGSFVWNVAKYFNLFGPDFWAWNSGGHNGAGHGHGGGHGH